MRILLIVESTSGGVGRHVMDLAEGLLSTGHDVTLVYSDLRADARFSRDVLALQEHGLAVERLRMARSPHLLDLSAALKLKKILRTQGPFDVVHSHSSKAGALARLTHFGSKSANIYTPHAFITMSPHLRGPLRFFFTAVERKLARRTHAIVAVSEAEREHALALGIPPGLLKIVENAIGPLESGNREALRNKIGVGSELVFGFVGRLSKQKAPHFLLQSFAMFADKHCRLVVVGAGPLERSSRHLAETLGVGERVFWAGPDEGSKWMAAFDVFLLPSIYESFPYVLLEARASGLPTVTTDTGACGQIVKDGETGFVVPVGDISAFVAAANKLSESSDLRTTMGAASLHLSKGQTLLQMVSQLERLYATSILRNTGSHGD